jgi:hypothetical protein
MTNAALSTPPFPNLVPPGYEDEHQDGRHRCDQQKKKLDGRHPADFHGRKFLCATTVACRLCFLEFAPSL